jgi:hypothetical protein
MLRTGLTETGAEVDGAIVNDGAATGKDEPVGEPMSGSKSAGKITSSTTWITPLHARRSNKTTSGSYDARSRFEHEEMMR